jgi:hypothetical protein
MTSLEARAARAEREWSARAKLKSGGFHDLEGRDRDGPLSDRGNLHPAVATAGSSERIVERIEHGSAYHTWAMDVVRTHRFQSQFERDCWASHADGDGIRETARKLRSTFHPVRNALLSVRAAIALTGRKGRQGKKPCRRELQRLIAKSNPALLLRLAAVLMQARPA